jgi:hypothetical protein
MGHHYKCPEGSFQFTGAMKQSCQYRDFVILLNNFAHILNHLLGITKDHHGFVHVEELVVESRKNKDLERYKKNKKN